MNLKLSYVLQTAQEEETDLHGPFCTTYVCKCDELSICGKNKQAVPILTFVQRMRTRIHHEGNKPGSSST